MNRRLRTLVLMGGPDAERDVSLLSGEQVVAALRCDPDLEVVPMVVDRPTAVELRAIGADVVFPVLHGPWGEGGPLQRLLASIGVPFVGCGPEAAALAMDKVATKRLAASVGVVTPEFRTPGPGEPCDLAPPVVVKPADEGSSVGLSICRSWEAVEVARRNLEAMGKRVLVERYVAGRELTVGVVDGVTLPIIEILPATEFYDYEAKYLRDDTRYLLDPSLPVGVADLLRDWTLRVWSALGCRDLARADFLLNESGPTFLELNTMPGMTTHSLVPMAARHAGHSMTDLCAGLVKRAFHSRTDQEGLKGPPLGGRTPVPPPGPGEATIAVPRLT